MKKYLIIVFIYFISISNIYGQISLGISIGGIGYHPRSSDKATYYKWKLDEKGAFVAFSSISFISSYRINDYVGLKFVQTFIFHDCAGKKAGTTHLGIQLYDDIIGFTNKIHEVNISFGPLWYYRKNWMKLPTYKNNPNFITLSKNKIWEKKFIWHGGLIEYSYKISTKNYASFNFLPGYPHLYTSVIGLNRRF